MTSAAVALAGAVVLVLAASAPLPAQAWSCACYKNLADPSYLGVMCTDMYVPSSITGWGRPVNTWFSIDCSSCSVDYNCTRAEEVELLPTQPLLKSGTKPLKPLTAGALPTLPEPGSEANLRGSMEEEDEFEPLDDLVGNNPVPCCCYAKQEYYYAKGIHCDALNPETGVTTCQSQEYGAQFIGTWYVKSLYNQCFFVVGQTGEGE